MRLTTNKNVADMGMFELAHNCCYIAEDGAGRYRDYEMDMDQRELVRELMKQLAQEDMPSNPISFDETMMDYLALNPCQDVSGLIALLYHNMWAMADLREKLKRYEDAEERLADMFGGVGMDRLTERTAIGVLVKEDYGEKALKTLYSCNGGKPNPHYTNCDEGYCAMEKLAAYEDAEEQGLLLRLPCKVGDNVYIIKPYGIEEASITGISEADDIDCFCFEVYIDPDCHEIIALEEFNDTWFLTREEAEAKLAEIEGSHAKNSSL